MSTFGFVNYNVEVYEQLRNVGCCRRCSLRYLGERSANAYKNVEEWVLEKGLEKTDPTCDTPNSKIVKCNPCIVCLGLLQELSSEDTVQKIASDVLSASYDSDTFTCAISLPISFQLRAHSLWLFLVDTFPVPYGDMLQEMQVTAIKDVWKWTLAPIISSAIKKDFDSGATCDFFVGITVSYSEDEKECSCLLQMHEELFQLRKTQKRKYHGNLYTRKSVESILNSTNAEHFKKFFTSPPSIPTFFVDYSEVTSSHNSIFFAGSYNKFSRSLSQTPWVIEGERRMESSVQEVICESIELVSKGDGSKFVASGREDVDVRMLGRGRPFACEVLNPRKTKFSLEEIESLELDINSCNKDVSIRNLQLVSKDELHHLKAGEEAKRKRYRALCVCYDNISKDLLNSLETITDLVLCQKTPIRVLHRRPLAIRNRTVYSMKAVPLDNVEGNKDKFLFKLDITTQAGTYIKEFVHGDFGRTKPNLGSLLNGADIDILALDVEEIFLDWPPPRPSPG